MTPFWSGFASGVASTIVAGVVIGFIVAMIIGWKIISADAEGLEPKSHIKKLTREDGGPGPIP